MTTLLRLHQNRSAAALAAGVFSLALLTGCAAGSEDPAASTSTTAPVAPASPSPSSAASSSAASGDSATTETDAAAETFTYTGEDGRTALELLLEADPSAEVDGEGEMAFVTGINGRTADPDANEFWGFYVDGEFAQEGAGTLVTEDGQEIEWKLETFE